MAGARDPQKLASMALGRLRRKLPALPLAWTGQCTAQHGRIIPLTLELIEMLARPIAELDEQLRGLVEPLLPPIEQRDPLPGVDVRAARDIRGEIGLEMRRFGSAARLSAWAKMSPGHHESAGKRRRGRTQTGHRDLRRIVVQWAWATRKTPTLLGRPFRRLQARIGAQKAAGAVGHKMLVIAYHLLAQGTYDAEQRSAEQPPKREERERKRAIKALARLGYNVTVQRVASLQGLRADRASWSPQAVVVVRDTRRQLARESCAFSASGISWEPHHLEYQTG